MTRVIIEGLHDRASLLSALQVVLEVLNRDGAFDLEEHSFVPSEPDQPESESDDRSGGVRLVDLARASWNQPSPTSYVPCPRRGTHDRLTDCWLCWSDVMRGAVVEPEVVSWEGWCPEIPEARRPDAGPGSPRDARGR